MIDDIVQGVGALVLLVDPLVEFAVEQFAHARSSITWRCAATSSAGGRRNNLMSAEVVMPSTSESVRTCSTFALPARVLPSLDIRVRRCPIEVVARRAWLPMLTSAISCVMCTK